MTEFITFQSDHGPIHFEVEDRVAQRFWSRSTSGAVAKGTESMTTQSRNQSGPDTRFERAMSTLKAYAGSIQDIVNGLGVRPREVTVEVGLTLKGEAGIFVIAKAGAEAEMKISLKWEPESKPKSYE